MEALNNQSKTQKSGDPTNHGLAATAQLAGVFCPNTALDHTWIIDGGATDHMCSDLNLFTTFHEVSGSNYSITISDGSKVQVTLVM